MIILRVSAGSAVLDLGGGCGVPVARRLAPRYAMTGVDLSPVQIERASEAARNRCEKWGPKITG
jgi:cyclopropane fatty-acyl-phospholipid synthase-like methyltransferase